MRQNSRNLESNREIKSIRIHRYRLPLSLTVAALSAIHVCIHVCIHVPTTQAFSVGVGVSVGVFSSRTATRLQVQPLDTAKEEGLTLDPSSSDTEDVSEWNAMSSWGASLLQLRKEEEEIMREIGDDDLQQDKRLKLQKEELPLEPRELMQMQMDVGTATELDSSVEKISVQELKDDMTVLPMPPQLATADKTQVSDMPLSRPEHYSDRIDRDKRLLAIGIAESVDEAWQWRRFYEEKGGIRSLLKTIQNGANFVQQEAAGSEFSNFLLEEYEETFLAACNACRALRDLCALSDDVRAVITDEILRANAASGNTTSLMKDFSSLLRHADEAEVLYSRLYNFRPKSNLFRLMGRKNRRGEYFCMRHARNCDVFDVLCCAL
jgi:hypothetical protein